MKKDDLIGIWKSDLEDETTRKFYGDVAMEFKDNGELIYAITENSKKQYIFMTYEVQGNKLLTAQLSLPKKEITDFRIIDNKLEMTFDGIKSYFLKRDLHFHS